MGNQEVSNNTEHKQNKEQLQTTTAANQSIFESDQKYNKRSRNESISKLKKKAIHEYTKGSLNGFQNISLAKYGGSREQSLDKGKSLINGETTVDQLNNSVEKL